MSKSPEILVDNPFVGKTYLCSSGDWSNEPTGYAYQWRRASADIAGSVAPTRTLTEADLGAMMDCRVTATNAAGNGNAVSNSIGPVQPPPAPVNTTPPVVLGTPRVGSALTATSGEWDNSPTSFLYVGLRNGIPIGPGGDTPVYVLQPIDEGAMMFVEVRATNAYGTTTVVSDPIGPVEPAPVTPDPPPVNTARPVVTGDIQVGNSLSSTPGEWTNNPSNYEYVWLRLPFEAEHLLPGVIIEDERNPTYLLTVDDVGQRIACQVTASNSEGSGTEVSLPVGPIQDVDWEPPGWLIRDSAIHEYDPFRPKPAYLLPTRDPVFHTMVTRITDNPSLPITNIPGAAWGTVVRHPGYQRQAWNCDQSLIYIAENSGTGAAGVVGLFLLGDVPYTPQFGRHANWPAGADMCWHPTNPDLMDCARGSLYSHFNVRTGEDTEIRNFGGTDYNDLRIGMNVGNRSTDGKVIVFTALAGGQRVAFGYNIETGTKYPDVRASSLSGTTFTSARVSADGEGILWNFTGDNYFYTDLNGTLIHTFITAQMALGDVCIDPKDDSVFVGRINSSGAGFGPGGLQNAWRLRDGQRNQLTASGYIYWASTRADNINHSGRARWALGDTRANRSGGNLSNPPYTCEMLLLPLDNSPVYRLCHNYNSTVQDNASFTHGSLSPDGQRCIFVSGWSNTNDANPRPVQVYVCDYRMANEPPEPVSPVNTVRPSITYATGGPTVGNTAICNSGTWTGANSFVRRWRRDDDPIQGATGVSYVLQEVDAGHMIDCVVVGVSSSTGGYAVATTLPVGPVTSPGSGGWEPPAWVITDRQVRDFNPARPRIGYLEPTRDPNFNGLVTRVSGDPGTPVGNVPGTTWGTVVHHHYINSQAWNCDQSMICLQTNSGGSGSGSIWIDGETYVSLYGRGTGWPSGADTRWHPTEPDLMDFARTSQFGYYNVRAGTNQVIHDFGSGYSDMRIGHNKGNRSQDGRIVVLTATKFGVMTAIVYDILNDRVIIELDPTVVAPGRVFSTCWTSPSGNYIIWNFSPDNYLITDLEGNHIQNFPTDYISHGDCCYDNLGDEVLVGRVNSSSVGFGPSGQIHKWRLRDGARTQLTQGGWCPHTSCRAANQNGSGHALYCVAATYNNRSGGNPQHPPYVGEIIMPTLDGETVYRLCQTYTINEYVYDEYPFAVPSPDSGRVIFSSTWGGAGSPPRPVQSYVVDIRT